MSNRIYEDAMFNEEIKEKFISEYGKGTQKIIARIFKISNAIESDLKKDLYSFSREELRRLMFLFMPTTENSSRHNVSWVSKYIDWAIDYGYKSGLNPLDTVGSDWHKQFVNNNIKKFWTTDEIYKIIDSRHNAQDAVIIILPFNGVGGEGHSEILNLTKKDVDAFNCKLHLDGRKRPIVVDEKCIKLCEAALREDTYAKMNGNTAPDNRADLANLVENDFVVRSANTNTEHFNEAEKNIVYRRLSKIANEINEPYFTPRNIAYSGMLAMAKELYSKSGKLDKEEYKLIADQFNFNMEQSLTRIRNEFLNLDTLKSLYPNI
ncbi:tyrosine-type recombinase/integrase [Paenibacillus elgii]|uniref:tyrosine-type recombinase/integrase n=1 Tax=Paenibacillus elgii TaxID=189691 RepID=UPI000248C6C3|nr:site-specific integrase [Paenibacillus elgii]